MDKENWSLLILIPVLNDKLNNPSGNKSTRMYIFFNDFDADDGLLIKKDTVAGIPSLLLNFFALHPLYTYFLCISLEQTKNITRLKVFFLKTLKES